MPATKPNPMFQVGITETDGSFTYPVPDPKRAAYAYAARLTMESRRYEMVIDARGIAVASAGLVTLRFTLKT